MTTVVISRDLMDAERFRAAIPGVVMARSIDEPALRHAALILLDLSLGVDPADAVAIGPPVIAYGAHVDTGALESALAAGCVDAVPRSRIFRRAAELLD